MQAELQEFTASKVAELQSELRHMEDFVKRILEEKKELQTRCDELKERADEMTRRHRGQTKQLTRIRQKADMACGYVNETGSLDEATLKGRAAGAEGAVDALIALYAGAKNGS